MDSCGEYFLFYRLTDFVIFSSGLKVWLLLVQDTFRLPPVISAVVSRYLITPTTVPQILVLVLHPEFGIRSIHRDLCPKTHFSYFLFALTEEGGYFRFGVLANHLAFSSFPWWFFRITISITRVRLPGTDSLTHIFSSFHGRPKLTYILCFSFNGQSLMAC